MSCAGADSSVSWQVTVGSTVRRMRMSVCHSPVTTGACACSAPTQPTTGHSPTSPATSATARQLGSCASASQASQVSCTANVHPVCTGWAMLSLQHKYLEDGASEGLAARCIRNVLLLPLQTAECHSLCTSPCCHGCPLAVQVPGCFPLSVSHAYGRILP